jgi:hypothetical protein
LNRLHIGKFSNPIILLPVGHIFGVLQAQLPLFGAYGLFGASHSDYKNSGKVAPDNALFLFVPVAIISPDLHQIATAHWLLYLAHGQE